jgi:hypothetical protein
MEEGTKCSRRVFHRRTEGEKAIREAAEGLELFKKTFVGIMALLAPPNQRISELLGANPVRPPTPAGWSRPPKKDSTYVSDGV